MCVRICLLEWIRHNTVIVQYSVVYFEETKLQKKYDNQTYTYYDIAYRTCTFNCKFIDCTIHVQNHTIHMNPNNEIHVV